MTSGFSIGFSMVRGPNRVLTPLTSAAFEIRSSSFVPPSQIFVWEGQVERAIYGVSKRPNQLFYCSCYRVFLSTFSCVFYPMSRRCGVAPNRYLHLEKYLKHARATLCSTRRTGTAEPTFHNAPSTHFSRYE
jgi:hypothetical protein